MLLVLLVLPLLGVLGRLARWVLAAARGGLNSTAGLGCWRLGSCAWEGAVFLRVRCFHLRCLLLHGSCPHGWGHNNLCLLGLGNLAQQALQGVADLELRWSSPGHLHHRSMFLICSTNSIGTHQTQRQLELLQSCHSLAEAYLIR